MRKQFKVGQGVRLLNQPVNAINEGTITQLGRHKVRVLFPINKTVWVSKEGCKVVRP
jgi:hypothetical protein